MKKNRYLEYYKNHPLTAVLFLFCVLLLIFAAFVVSTGSALVWSGNGIYLQQQNAYVKGQIVVTFDVNQYSQATDILSAFGLTYQLISSESSGNIYVYNVDVPVGQEQTWINKFQGIQGVLSAHYATLK